MPNEHTIAENLQRLIDAKTSIGNAITAKGGTVGQNDGLEEFPADIGSIQGGLEMNVTFAVDSSGNKCIPDYMFYNNHGSGSYNTGYNIEEVVIGDSISKIYGYAFSDCRKLKSVTIGSGIVSIDMFVFGGTTNLETITIKKPQGSVSGAPWGAPNATIVWTG